MSTRITRRREETLQQWPNEEGEKEPTKRDSVKPVRAESRTEKKMRRRRSWEERKREREREVERERGEDG